MDSQSGNYILSNYRTLGTRRIVPVTRNQDIAQTQMLYGRTSKKTLFNKYSYTRSRKLHIAQWLRSARPHSFQALTNTKNRNTAKWRPTSFGPETEHVRNAAERRQHRFWYSALEQSVGADASSSKVYDLEGPSPRQRLGVRPTIDTCQLKAKWVKPLQLLVASMKTQLQMNDTTYDAKGKIVKRKNVLNRTWNSNQLNNIV